MDRLKFVAPDWLHLPANGVSFTESYIRLASISDMKIENDPIEKNYTIVFYAGGQRHLLEYSEREIQQAKEDWLFLLMALDIVNPKDIGH